jgi:hypothetical protein
MKAKYYVIVFTGLLIGLALLFSLPHKIAASAISLSKTNSEKDFQYFVIQLAVDATFQNISYGEIYITEFLDNFPDTLAPKNHVLKGEYSIHNEDEKNRIMDFEYNLSNNMYNSYKKKQNWNIKPVMYSRLFTVNNYETLYVSKTKVFSFDTLEFPSPYCIQYSKWHTFTDIIYVDTLRFANGKSMDIKTINKDYISFIKQSFNKNLEFINQSEIYARIIGVRNDEYYKTPYYHFINMK